MTHTEPRSSVSSLPEHHCNRPPRSWFVIRHRCHFVRAATLSANTNDRRVSADRKDESSDSVSSESLELIVSSSKSCLDSELLARKVVIQPRCAINSSWVPISGNTAFFKHERWNALLRMVLQTIAPITIVVRPASNRARLSWIARSDSVSSALVASSKINSGGLL